MKKIEITYAGRIKEGYFGRYTNLLQVKSTSFKEIFEELISTEGAKKTLQEEKERAQKYYGREELKDLEYMNIINEATERIEGEEITRWGNWSMEKKGKTHYLRAYDLEAKEWETWTNDK